MSFLPSPFRVCVRIYFICFYTTASVLFHPSFDLFIPILISYSSFFPCFTYHYTKLSLFFLFNLPSAPSLLIPLFSSSFLYLRLTSCLCIITNSLYFRFLFLFPFSFLPFFLSSYLFHFSILTHSLSSLSLLHSLFSLVLTPFHHFVLSLFPLLLQSISIPLFILLLPVSLSDFTHLLLLYLCVYLPSFLSLSLVSLSPPTLHNASNKRRATYCAIMPNFLSSAPTPMLFVDYYRLMLPEGLNPGPCQ
jgi:hypothetical protein